MTSGHISASQMVLSLFQTDLLSTYTGCCLFASRSRKRIITSGFNPASGSTTSRSASTASISSNEACPKLCSKAVNDARC